MPTSNISHEQIKIFRSLFLGREDAYGLETPTGPVTVREPLTDVLIADHLKGLRRIGAFLVGKHNKVISACIDIDREDKKLVEITVATLVDNDFFPYIERSKSKGYHVWVFFDEAIEAVNVRKVLSRIMNETKIDGIEIFPKQDSIDSNNGLGNYVFLPLHGQSVKKGGTVFVNLEFNPYEDQWQYLSKIHRTKAENILSLAKNLPDETKSQHQKADSPPEGSLDLAKYLIHYNISFKIKQDGSRTFYLLNRCLFADNHTTKDNLGDSAIVQNVSGKITFQCFHGHCRGRTWADVRKIISGDDSLSQFCKGYSQNKQGRNLIEDVRSWVENAFSKFTMGQICRDLSIATPKDRTHLRVELHRMVEKGILERGSVNGTFIKIESQTRTLEIKKQVPVPLPLVLPGNVHQHVAIYRKNLLVGAGSSNGGKTAYGLNVAYENRDKFDVWYFTTEMDSDELTLRIHNFGYLIKEWDKVKFSVWESCHSIKPDAFNILDYLEVREGEFWRVGDDLRRIFERLGTGIALVFIQMDRGRQFGWGGQKTVDKARLYFTLDDNKLTIIKGKNWKGKDNPNGKSISFKLHNGAAFEWGDIG